MDVLRVLRAAKVADGGDRTREADYAADADDPRVHEIDLRAPGAVRDEPVQY